MLDEYNNSADADFAAHVSDTSFPCLAAKTAHARGQITHVYLGSIACGRQDAEASRAIAGFAATQKPEHVFHSLILHFTHDRARDELAFERAMFARLQGIHEHDREQFAWDKSVSDDPASPQFSMSVGGRAFYVVGLHPAASRPARRLAHPAMVFNLHSQFEYLRAEGRYERLRDAIIERDVQANGSANPMLAVHGVKSEALQYSGREIEGAWRCPFNPLGDKA